MPYEDIFDRAERTFAALHGKFGDLTHNTPVVRIGFNM
jgi:hypothetical protein